MKDSTRRRLRYTNGRWQVGDRMPPPVDWRERRARWEALLADKNALITELYAEVEDLRAVIRNQGDMT